MSRGGLLLRAARADVELAYRPIDGSGPGGRRTDARQQRLALDFIVPPGCGAPRLVSPEL